MIEDRIWPKPRVLISACLNFESCRFNGGMIKSERVKQLESFVDFIKICPEVAIGLGTPREAIRLVENDDGPRLVTAQTGEDHTDAMRSFSRNFLSSLGELDGAILKSKSPSCGLGRVKIYASESHKQARRHDELGIFASEVLLRNGIFAIEDEDRLRNQHLFELFLIRVFTMARFRTASQNKSMGSLVQFHGANKYLYMADSPQLLKKLGRIVANPGNDSVQKVFADYRAVLACMFRKTQSRKLLVNAFTHIYGYFKKELNEAEKNHFFYLLERYRNYTGNYLPIRELLYSWAVRFKNDYLVQQSLLLPYPAELLLFEPETEKQYQALN